MFVLHTYPDRFVVDVDGQGWMHASHDGNPPDSLVIDRTSGAIARSKGPQRTAHGAAFSERIDAIVGIITSEDTRRQWHAADGV